MRDLVVLGVVVLLFALMIAWQQADTREWRKANRELLAENRELRRYVAVLSKHPTGVNLLIQNSVDRVTEAVASIIGVEPELPYARRRADDED